MRIFLIDDILPKLIGSFNTGEGKIEVFRNLLEDNDVTEK